MAVYEPPSPPPAGGGSGPVPERRRTGGGELRLTHADRDAAAETLREAYASGQLDESEFDERLGLAINAKFPSELEPLLTDLVRAGQSAPDSGPRVTGATPAASENAPGADRLLAGIGHASGYVSSFVGPLVLLLASRQASPFVRRHITEALNFQVTVAVGTIAAMGLSFLILPLIAWGFMMLGWLFLPAVAGLTALLGGNMRYPLTWRPVRAEQVGDQQAPGKSRGGGK
ncbi:hypothetical protein GCM10027570_33660 [Streptomonospora sediminis]